MRFLLINSSPRANGASATALDAAARVFLQYGAEVDIFELGAAPRSACTACGKCKTDGECVIGDIGELTEKLRRASGIIIATPTHYAGAVGTLISVLSRVCFSAKDVFDGKPVACIAAARRAGCVSASEEITRFFSFTGAIGVYAGYPPHIYGGERDSEGLCYAGAVAERMLWLARVLKCAEDTGLVPPAQKSVTRVNI